MRLQDKVAIVTGGGSGFGAGICAKFVAEGARVLVADVNEQAAAEVAQALGPSARAQRVDVAKAADVRAMMEAAVQHFGRIDILVNNAGVTHLPSLCRGIARLVRPRPRSLPSSLAVTSSTTEPPPFMKI